MVEGFHTLKWCDCGRDCERLCVSWRDRARRVSSGEEGRKEEEEGVRVGWAKVERE